MELTLSSSVSMAMVSCLCLAVLTSPASAGKCRGKWMIHACFGGNGKRSDPSLETAGHNPPSLLDKLLSNDVRSLRRIIEDRMEAPPSPPNFENEEDEERFFGGDERVGLPQREQEESRLPELGSSSSSSSTSRVSPFHDRDSSRQDRFRALRRLTEYIKALKLRGGMI